MAEISIVVIAYNRPESLKRLMSSLLIADYQGDEVDLIISIDYSGRTDVYEIADAVNWPYGKKILIKHEANLGLREHVLTCGDLTDQYRGICVFEDDIFASPGFYSFAKQALCRYQLDPKIAGISLYGNSWNQYVDRPFQPIDDGTDVYFMQVASSWGQIWYREAWCDFRIWLVNKNSRDLVMDGLPLDVTNWSEKSWLKYHNAYLVETNRYFVHPRVSLSTNFSDQGEHALESTTYQVPILLKAKENYNFPLLAEGIQYDAFYEYKFSKNIAGINIEDIDISLFGNKPERKRYRLSVEMRNEKIIKSYGLKLRPIEFNIQFEVAGDDIFLYDTTISCAQPSSTYVNRFKRYLYEMRSSNKKDMFLCAMILYFKAMKRKISLIGLWGK